MTDVVELPPPPQHLPSSAVGAAATILCTGCAAHIPAAAFDPSSIQHRKHRCRECRARAQKQYRSSKRAVFLALNLRRQAERTAAAGLAADPAALKFSAADASAALERFGGRCVVSGEADIMKLTLVKLRHEKPLSVQNVAPVAKALVLRSSGELLWRIMDAAKKLAPEEDFRLDE